MGRMDKNKEKYIKGLRRVGKGHVGEGQRESGSVQGAS